MKSLNVLDVVIVTVTADERQLPIGVCPVVFEDVSEVFQCEQRWVINSRNWRKSGDIQDFLD